MLKEKIKEKSIFRKIGTELTIDRDDTLKILNYSNNKAMWLGDIGYYIESEDIDKPAS